MIVGTFLIGLSILIIGIFLMFLGSKYGLVKLISRKQRPNRIDLLAFSLTLIVVGGLITFFGIMLNEGYV